MKNQEKTHWRKFHNPDYIGAYAFQPGEHKVLTIVTAGMEKVTGQNGKKEECLVVHFDAKHNEKPMICNVTNSKSIEKVNGSGYIDDWPGTTIELYVATVQAFGDTVEAIRVKPDAPKLTKPELTDQHPAYDKVVQAVASGSFDRADVEKKYTVSDEIWNQIKSKADGSA